MNVVRCALIGIVVCTQGFPLCGAIPVSSFALLAESEGPSTFEAVGNATFRDYAEIVRARDAPAATKFPTISGRAVAGTLERYENRFVRVRPANDGDFVDYGLDQAKLVSTEPLEGIYLQSVDFSSWGVLGAIGERAAWPHLVSSVNITSVHRYPYLSSLQPYDVPIIGTNPNEMTSIPAGGKRIVLQATAHVLELSGNVVLYWFDSTIHVDSSTGPRVFRSVATVTPGSGPGAQILEESWFVLRLENAAVQLGIPEANRSLAQVTFCRETDFEVSSAAIAAPGAINGTLPNSTRRDGASFWIEGNLTVTIRLQDGEGSRQAYRLGLAGSPKSYSIAGGKAIPASAIPSKAVVSTAAAVLALLVVRGAFALFAKLRREDVLRHQLRARIHTLIQKWPGIEYSGIVEDLRSGGDVALGLGFVQHHLAKLENYGFVVSARAGRYRRYYPREARASSDIAPRALLQTRPMGDLARLILERQGSREDLFARLPSSLRISRSTLSYHLGRLERVGLVHRRRAGRSQVFSATDALTRLVLETPLVARVASAVEVSA